MLTDYLLSASHCVNKANIEVGEQTSKKLLEHYKEEKPGDNSGSAWKGHQVQTQGVRNSCYSGHLLDLPAQHPFPPF